MSFWRYPPCVWRWSGLWPGSTSPPRLRPTNADRLLGAVAVVTQEIDNRSATGQVKVSGQIWTARSQGEDPIPVGTSVTVLRIEGVKLIVQAKAPVPV